jgi:hypothetical protein
MMFEDETPKASSWFVPLVIGALLLFFGLLLQVSDWQHARTISALMIILALLCAPLVMTEFWRYWTSHQERLHSEHQAALSTTPVVLLAQYMQRMHPEAIRVLERFGVRTSWQVRIDLHRNARTWILEGTNPNVHFGFIEFVLTHSGRALYPRNRFKDGSKKWDPDGIVEDREQHAEFEAWLHSRLMVTRSHGEYKPAEFIPPWTPKLIMETMGLTGEQELHQPEEGSTSQVPRTSLQDMAETRPVQKAVPQAGSSQVRRQDAPVEEDIPPVNEEALQAEMERYGELFASGVVPDSLVIKNKDS